MNDLKKMEELMDALDKSAPKGVTITRVAQCVNLPKDWVVSMRGCDVAACLVRSKEVDSSGPEAYAQKFWQDHEESNEEHEKIMNPGFNPDELYEALKCGALPAGTRVELPYEAYNQLRDSLYMGYKKARAVSPLFLTCPEGGYVEFKPQEQEHEKHHEDCGTKYRDRSPDCPADLHDKAETDRRFQAVKLKIDMLGLIHRWRDLCEEDDLLEPNSTAGANFICLANQDFASDIAEELIREYEGVKIPFPSCDCGGTKAGTPHSTWCSAR